MNRSDLLLHPDAKVQIEQLLCTPPHAAIISGSAGTGKSHLAGILASELLGADIAKGNNPYYREVSPDKASITIEQVRKLIQFFQLQVPGKSAVKRVATIIDADTMGSEAQNALLKLLEEPPEGSVVLLTTSHIVGLLPTIRSRAQSLVLPDPTKVQIADYFTAKGYAEAVVQRTMLRHGVNLAAITTALEGQAEDIDTALSLVKKALSGNQFERMLLVDPLSKQKDQAISFTDTLATVVMASLETVAKKGGQTARWQHMLEVTNTAQEALARSGNTKLVLTELMLAL